MPQVSPYASPDLRNENSKNAVPLRSCPEFHAVVPFLRFLQVFRGPLKCEECGILLKRDYPKWKTRLEFFVVVLATMWAGSAIWFVEFYEDGSLDTFILRVLRLFDTTWQSAVILVYVSLGAVSIAPLVAALLLVLRLDWKYGTVIRKPQD